MTQDQPAPASDPPAPVRFGWGRLLTWGLVAGLVAGLPLAVAVVLADYPGWAELTWQLAVVLALILGLFTPVMRLLVQALHVLETRHYDERPPVDEQLFVPVRLFAPGTTFAPVVAGCLTVAFWQGTGQAWPF